MSGKWVDFRRIKETVSIEMVLAHYRVDIHRLVGNQLRGRCPLPTHSSRDSTQSFAVDLARNIWACHSDSCMSARSGRIGGNILDFVSVMENCSVRNAALKIQSWFGLPEAKAHGVIARSLLLPAAIDLGAPLVEEDSQSSQPLSFQLRPVDTAHDYLGRRAVDRVTAEFFGVGFYGGQGIMRGRVVVPIHDAKGELLAYAGRVLDNTQPRYRFPAGFRKSLVLFNLHRVLANKDGGCDVVVEGFFACFKVHQAGEWSVVALIAARCPLRVYAL